VQGRFINQGIKADRCNGLLFSDAIAGLNNQGFAAGVYGLLIPRVLNDDNLTEATHLTCEAHRALFSGKNSLPGFGFQVDTFLQPPVLFTEATDELWVTDWPDVACGCSSAAYR